MKLLRGIQHVSAFDKGVVATIGNFDGVHLGHQNLLKTLRNKANHLKLPLVLILFEPQPREYFQQEKAPARLSSLREKLDVLRTCQIDYVYCIKFDNALAQTSAADFVRTYLFSILNVNYLLVGEDFRFGKNREGDVRLLMELSAEHACDVSIYSNFCMNEDRISSTRIRMALQHGDLNTAAKYLGRLYSICGRVLHGDGRGRQWGIPTANLALHRTALPIQGVFVVQVRIVSQIVYGVANVGRRPTVDGSKNVLEVHLFDFERSIYGELLQVFFLHKLRDEVKFTSVDALIAQIYDDIAAAKEFLRNYNELPQYQNLGVDLNAD
ncbi:MULTISPECIES: bifunctional riboflavin kinase/FAD synthetase [Legionella]|uniref:Riboflavin biosynthesis protein n=1 Tax=Legionella steelei TaxID=947033 RepID=A0A0W0ZIH6_9GAMM|nr:MULTISPECIES: bifunctional riboflavin kinase/FAD synthetase [Legionella]KTD68808.1 riboflavin biosynthesis protein RibF (riboflavin kinase/FMN adenylyltransferase) [Legionella steelei]MBN9227705.1 bifunctional riboflavin kinase/FAD synthetase [Legionella steelei]OJW14608.1 MAG: riboflavin biosynthesis protein RibF [Legionella sp. 39-23]